MTTFVPHLDLVILVPVLRRPLRVKPFLESWDRSQTGSCRLAAKMRFVVQDDDKEERMELQRWGVPCIVVASHRPRWSQKINCGVGMVKADWYWFAADDLDFQVDWYPQLQKWLETQTDLPLDGSEDVVIGSNDGANPATAIGETSTHPIVSRGYLEHWGPHDVDGRPRPLHEGYHHNFVDTEFVAVAKHRHKYRHAPFMFAKHLHPTWGLAPMDDTYRLGRRRYAEDEALFRSRRAAGGW